MTAPGTPPDFEEPTDNVYEMRQDRVDALRALLVDSDGLDSLPEPEPLISGLLFRNSTAWLIGKSGHGKSFVAIDMVGCIATGMDWQDHAVHQGPVLYVVAEGKSGMRQRVRAWERSYGRKMTGVHWLPLAVQVQSTDWRALIAVAGEIQPSLIVLDTQARITVGLEENSAKDMGIFNDKITDLCGETGACVLVVHHKGRAGDNMRGSSALDGASDTTLEAVKDGNTITLKNPKQKDAEEHEDIDLLLSPNGESAVLVNTGDKGPKGMEQAIKFGTEWWELFGTSAVTVTKLVEAEMTTKPSFYRHVKLLLDAGHVTKDDSGRSTYYSLIRLPVS
ncbi:MAG TPA: AAA family ATPase [Pseudonocardia sp.]